MNATNLYAVLLDAVHRRFDRPATEQLLNPLEMAVRDSSERIARVATEDSPFVDAVIDNECDEIEEFLGIGFIVCQISIKSVASAVERLQRYHKRVCRGHLTTTTSGTVLRHGLAPIAGLYTAIEVLNASANYYKHRDEWHGAWATFTGQQAATATVIQAAGAEEGSTGNLRAIAHVLGNPEFSRMGVYCDPIAQWSKALYNSYKGELKALGLV